MRQRVKVVCMCWCPVTHQHPHVDWERDKERFRETTLNSLSAIGLSDIRDRIRVEHCITPKDWEDQYAIYRGATFNLAHNPGQMLHRRPRNRFQRIGWRLSRGWRNPSGQRLTSHLRVESNHEQTAT